MSDESSRTRIEVYALSLDDPLLLARRLIGRANVSDCEVVRDGMTSLTTLSVRGFIDLGKQTPEAWVKQVFEGTNAAVWAVRPRICCCYVHPETPCDDCVQGIAPKPIYGSYPLRDEADDAPPTTKLDRREPARTAGAAAAVRKEDFTHRDASEVARAEHTHTDQRLFGPAGEPLAMVGAALVTADVEGAISAAEGRLRGPIAGLAPGHRARLAALLQRLREALRARVDQPHPPHPLPPVVLVALGAMALLERCAAAGPELIAGLEPLIDAFAEEVRARDAQRWARVGEQAKAIAAELVARQRAAGTAGAADPADAFAEDLQQIEQVRVALQQIPSVVDAAGRAAAVSVVGARPEQYMNYLARILLRQAERRAIGLERALAALHDYQRADAGRSAPRPADARDAWTRVCNEVIKLVVNARST